MEWAYPELINLSIGGIDAEKNCRDGGGPAKACIYGGALSSVTCHGGSEIAWEVCASGGSIW